MFKDYSWFEIIIGGGWIIITFLIFVIFIVADFFKNKERMVKNEKDFSGWG